MNRQKRNTTRNGVNPRAKQTKSKQNRNKNNQFSRNYPYAKETLPFT